MFGRRKNNREYPSAQSVYKNGDFSRALALKYFEIADEEIDNQSENFKHYISELSRNESKEVCIIGYTIRKAEKKLTGKSITRISPEITKLLKSNNKDISNTEAIAYYLDENNKIGIGNRAANYTLIPIKSVNKAFEIWVDDLLEGLKLKESASAEEVFFRLISFGYLFRIAEEIVSDMNHIQHNAIIDMEIIYDEDDEDGQEIIDKNGKHWKIERATAKEIEHAVGY